MRRRKHPALLCAAVLVAVLGSGSMLGWEQVNDRDWFGSRNLGIRLYGNSITMSLEQDGSFDIADGSDLTAIRNAFATINAIPTSDATVVEGPTFDYPANIDSEAGYSPWDEVNRIYFFNVDSDNSFFGVLAATAVYYDQFTGLILGSPGWPNRGGCDIAVNDLDYTWSTATPADPNEPLPANTYDIQSVLTHELMHCFGFEHSAVAGSFDAATGLEVSGFTSGDYSLQATLFPYAAPNIQGRTLEPDDIAAFSEVYPSATASTTLGQISGRILRPDGSGVKGAHVVAVPTSDPTRPVVGRLSGIEADTDPGGYRLTGLAPGNYYVRIEPLPGTTNPFTELNTGFIGFDTTFSPEFYSGASESAVDATISASDAAAVTVVAGGTTRGIDIIVNPASVGPALSNLPARRAFVGTQGGTNPAAQSFSIRNVGSGSGPWYISGNPSWLSVSPSRGTLTAAANSVTVSPDLTGLSAGIYRAKVVAQAPTALNNPQAVSVILVVNPTGSAIRTVCPSGCGYTTIQGAIDAATSGDTVRVGPGHYLEHIVMKDGVKLVGAGADLSVIDAGGSGIVVMCASNALLDGFTITGGNNTTIFDFGYLGGGIKCKNIADTTISHNVIKYNQIPEQGAMGAGLYAGGTRISILDNVFRLNTGGYYDAFAGDVAGGDGGGLYVSGSQGSIARNRIMDNLAGEGGGIFTGVDGTVTDNLIAKNEVTTFGGYTGGGITVWGGSGPTLQITNNTIADNFNGLLPGNISGIERYAGYPPEVTNTILWGHRYWDGVEYVGAECDQCPTVNYSTVEGGHSGTGNSSADPLFRDRPGRDYRLMSSSPAIDAGSNTTPAISSYDLSGVPRIMDGNNDGLAVVDMGAYEFQTNKITVPNSGVITINDHTVATPYPSTITVAGFSGVITKVTVQLNNFNHTNPADVDVLLVAPNGGNAIIMSDVGGSTAVSGVNLTLDDAAASPLPEGGPLVSGTFQPTNVGGGDSFPSPAPTPSGGSALSTFTGIDPNGTWSLYVVDAATGGAGSFAGGWTLIFEGLVPAKRGKNQVTSE